MNRYVALIILGFVVVLMPLSGFPTFWKGLFEILSGAATIVIAIFLYREHLINGASHEEVSAHQSTYVESKDL
jgi:hypothetical protein